jgi:hypothetical protein
LEEQGKKPLIAANETLMGSFLVAEVVKLPRIAQRRIAHQSLDAAASNLKSAICNLKS